MVVMLLPDLYKVINAFSSGSSILSSAGWIDGLFWKRGDKKARLHMLKPLNFIRASWQALACQGHTHWSIKQSQ